MDAISLSEIAGGELQVKAERAIQDVMKNLKDTNTPWKNKRKVQITLCFTQNEERDDVTCDISVEKKLASAKPTSTKFAIEQDLDNGEVFPKNMVRM